MAVTSSITPNMSLVTDIPNVTNGPQWGIDTSTNFTTIDSHNHTSGSGIQIPVAGLNINTDLPLQNNNLTFARSVILNNNAAPLSLSSDIGSLSNVSGNMTWNNGTGVAIQITAGNSLNSGLIGGITGLGGSAAAVTYSDSSKTFTFTANPTASAGIDVGNITAHGKLFITGSGGVVIDQKIDTTSGATGSFTIFTTAGNVLISSSAGGATIISSSGLISNSPVTFSSSLNVVGNANLTGNLNVKGILTVAGATTLQNVNAQSGTFLYVTASSLNAATLLVQNASTLSSTLNVVGATALSGAARLGSDLQVAGNATVTGTVNVVGAVALSSSLNVIGAQNLVGNTTMSGNLNINSTPVKLNTGNTATNTTMLTLTGDVNAQGGFRQQVGPATYEAGTFTLPQNMVVAMYNGNNGGGGSLGFASFQWVAPFQGTIVAISAYSNLAAQSFTIQPQIAGTNSTLSLGIAGTGAATTATTKDSAGNTFTAGQVITIQIQGANNNFNLQTQVWLTIEC